MSVFEGSKEDNWIWSSAFDEWKKFLVKTES